MRSLQQKVQPGLFLTCLNILIRFSSKDWPVGHCNILHLFFSSFYAKQKSELCFQEAVFAAIETPVELRVVCIRPSGSCPEAKLWQRPRDLLAGQFWRELCVTRDLFGAKEMPATVCICACMCFVAPGPGVGRSWKKNPTKIISSVADTLFTNHCDIYIGLLQEIVPCLDNCTRSRDKQS